MINITSIDRDGIIQVRQYDNKTAKFFQDGEPVILKSPKNKPKQSACSQKTNETVLTTGNVDMPVQENIVGDISAKLLTAKERKQRNTQAWDGKSNDLKTLKIQLGLGCNYSCGYCKQAIHVNASEHSNMKDVTKFIAEFDLWCKTPKEDDIRIELWGGEPFVYFKKI